MGTNVYRLVHTVCAIELGRDAPESTRVHTFTYPPAIMVM